VTTSFGIEKNRVQVTAIVMAIVCLALAGPAVAQQSSAALSVRVRAASGAPLAGARIELRDIATGVRRTAMTDQNGRFAFEELPVGTYELTVTAAGFAGKKEQLTIKIGQPRDADFVLTPDSGKPAATGDAAIKAFEWTGADRQQIERLLNEQRAAGMALVLLVPSRDKVSLALVDKPTDGNVPSYTVIVVNDPLEPASLVRAVAAQAGKRLLGVHKLNANAYLLVFR